MALDFDGVDDAVSFGYTADLVSAAALTVMMWIFPTTNDIASGWWGNRDADGGIMIYEESAATFTVTFDDNSNFGGVASLLTTGAWGHYAFVFNGGGSLNADRLKIYKDGTAQTVAFTGTIPATISANAATTVQLARRPDIAGEFSDGNIAHHKVWLAALSAAEVAQEVHSRRPHRTAGLHGWWPLDDGTDTKDYSGNGRDGTVASAPAQVSGPPVSYGAPVLVY